MRALGLELRRHACLISDADQERAPTLFDQRRLGQSARDADAALRVDVNVEQAAPVQDGLNSFKGARFVLVLESAFERLPVRGAEWLAQIVHRFDEPLHLRDERLNFHGFAVRRPPERGDDGREN